MSGETTEAERLAFRNLRLCAPASNPPWPSGQRQGFGTGRPGFDPQSRRNGYDGVSFGNAHFIV